MLVLIIGLVVFFGIHSVRLLAPDVRARQAEAGLMRWKGIYAAISLVGLVLIVWGYALWRPEAPQLYLPPEWGRHVTYPLVWVAMILLAAAKTPAGHIKQSVQHPMLVGTMLWAIGHLFANGDAAGVLTFGVALVWAVADTISSLRRGEPRPVAKGWRGDLIAIAIGTVVTLALIFGLHALLFGVSPLA